MKTGSMKGRHRIIATVLQANTSSQDKKRLADKNMQVSRKGGREAGRHTSRKVGRAKGRQTSMQL